MYSYKWKFSLWYRFTHNGASIIQGIILALYPTDDLISRILVEQDLIGSDIRDLLSILPTSNERIKNAWSPKGDGFDVVFFSGLFFMDYKCAKSQVNNTYTLRDMYVKAVMLQMIHFR